MIRPTFKASYHVAVIEPDTVIVLSENDCRMLSGPVYTQLAPLLSGDYTVPDIAAQLAETVPVTHVMLALQKLEAGGYIVEASDSLPRPQAAFWHTLNAPDDASIRSKSVMLRAVGETDTEPLTQALRGVGIETADAGDLLIVVTDDYLHDELATLNQQARAADQAWLPVKLIGEILWIGPLIDPHDSACWECMAHRIRLNRPVENFVKQRRADKSTPLKTSRSALQATTRMAANIAATEIAKALVQDQAKTLHNRLVTFNTLTLELASHTVTRRPQCAVCGSPERFRADRDPEPIILEPRPKRFDWNPGQRSLLPEEAFARHQSQISPITGVITHLIDNLPATDGMAYSYTAGHDFSLMTNDINALYRNMLGRSSGKGMTDTQAKMSAIGEAMERYSGIYRSEGEIIRRASYQQLGDQALYPNDIWLYSEAQYTNRIEWNKQQKSSYHRVYKPFDETAVMDWTPYWSLTQQTARYFPAFCSYFGHPDIYNGYGSCDSNGCASENTLEEAIYQGFLELVERDSVAMWWYNRLKRPRVDLDSFELPYTRQLEAYYRTLNRSLWVIDLTADLQIPTFAAVSGRLDRKPEDILVGFGAHLDAKTALLRALSEVNQFLTNVFYTNPDGTTRYLMDVDETIEWFKTATMDNQPYLLPDESQPIKTLADYPILVTNDFRGDVETCVSLAQSVGLEVLVLDQSRPDVGMKVCRVIVPGLRHFWRRLAPGRLYDVPVKLGWLNQPIAEDALNPVSMFF